MASLDSIHQLLAEATGRLNEAIQQIRDLPLEPRKEHMHRVGKALSEIYDIQYHIFALRPELTPQVLNGPFQHPQGALNVAMRHAHSAEQNGNIDVAVAILKWIVPRVSGEHAQLAEAEIARLQQNRDA
jgi:hypothetical protein